MIADAVLRIVGSDRDLGEEFRTIEALDPDFERQLRSATRLPALYVGVTRIAREGRLLWTEVTAELARLTSDDTGEDPHHEADVVTHLLEMIYRDGGELDGPNGECLTYKLERFDAIPIRWQPEGDDRQFAVMTIMMQFATPWRRKKTVL